MQVGEFALELHQRMIVAGDIAGAAGAGTHPGRSLDHGADHLGILAHAEVVVGAPDNDVFCALRRVPQRVRKASGNALEVGEYPIAPFGMKAPQRPGEIVVIIDVGAIIGIGHRQTVSGAQPA